LVYSEIFSHIFFAARATLDLQMCFKP